jgi:FAD/FMN-containing dehydrogenase
MRQPRDEATPAQVKKAVEGFLDQLRATVGASHVLTEHTLTGSYESDWTGRFKGPCLAVVRPRSTAEVSEVLRCCRDAGIAVIPQGGNTGLVGGSVPRAPSLTSGRPRSDPASTSHCAPPRALSPVVLSMRRLDNISRCDTVCDLLEAGAGTTLGSAQRAAGAIGRELGIDLAARDSATLGGMVATNAGGIHVVRHGSMRARLAGIEAVLADGSVLRRMDGLWKDNVGWSLCSLLAGSEGTLAVVTAVSMRLVPRAAHRVTALVALRGDEPSRRPRQEAVTSAALSVSAALRRRVDGLEALEITYRPGMMLVAGHAGLPAPPCAGSAEAWLTIEAAGAADPAPALAAALEDEPGVLDAAVATEPGRREQLWAYREHHAEAIATLGMPHKLDVSLPLDRLAHFAGSVEQVVQDCSPGATTICFGHLADGNLHVNVIGPTAGDESVDHAVLASALAHKGSISAEHGIGVAKVGLVTQARSSAEIAVMRSVKEALDPEGILNPGVLIPPDDTPGAR